MIAKNAKQLLQTALRNAVPMTAQGYKYEPSIYNKGVFYVIHPTAKKDENKPVEYAVDLRYDICNCQYFTENRTAYQFWECTCKHIEWVRACEKAREEAEAAATAEYEAHEQARLDAENERIEAAAERIFWERTGHTMYAE